MHCDLFRCDVGLFVIDGDLIGDAVRVCARFLLLRKDPQHSAMGYDARETIIMTGSNSSN